MNRRRFLSTTALSGVAFAAFANAAHALSVQDYNNDPDSTACSELTRHDNLRAQIEELLTERGLSEEQRKVVLAAATCPFCGQLLFG